MSELNENIVIRSVDKDTGIPYDFILTQEHAQLLLENLHLEHFMLGSRHVYPRETTIVTRNSNGGGGTATLDRADVINQVETQLR